MLCLTVCLSECRLTLSIGKTDSVPASSCKEVRDVLSNECSGRPQSGTYWINITDQCTGDNKTMRVGQKHMSLGVQQVESRVMSKYDTDQATNGDKVNVHLSHDICNVVNHVLSLPQAHTPFTTPLHSVSLCYTLYRCIVKWAWMEGAGPWCGSTPTWRFSHSPQPCTTSANTTGSAPTWRQDGATYQIRDTFSQQR